MYWPDTQTGVDVEPARKPVASAVRKFFSEGGAGQPPTVPGGDWFNQITNELLNVLAAAGIDPSKTDDDQLLQAITAIITSLSDTTLRSDLSGTNGVSLVGNAADKRGQVFTGEVIAPGLKSTAHYGGVIVGDNPMGSAGNDWPLAASLRDAINVSRKIVNEPTDCHAFADKTILDSASDYGGYGAFDATTILRGNNLHNHVAAFQSRISYQGGGTLENLWGHIIWPTATGSGNILANVGIQIKGVETTTASVQSNRGIDIDPKAALQENIGIIVRNGACASGYTVSYNSQQGSDGYSFYADKLGTMYNRGKVFLGHFGPDGADPLPLPGMTTLNLRDTGSANTCGLGADNSNGAYILVNGDNRVSFISNGLVLGFWGTTANSRGFMADSDNTQPLGNASKRWSVVYAGTGAINTSDAREKTAPLPITDAVLDAWGDVQLIAFQWLESIRAKGDGARWHFGVIAQQVRDAFAAHGLDGTLYGLLCYDEWEEEFADFVVVDGYFEEVVIAEGHYKVETKQVERPCFESVTVQRNVIDMVDGVCIMRQMEVVERRPVVIHHPVFNPDGSAVLDSETGDQVIYTVHQTEVVDETHQEWVPPVKELREVAPVLESRKVREAGNRWGIRIDQCLFLEAAAARRKAQRLEERLSAIEKTLHPS